MARFSLDIKSSLKSDLERYQNEGGCIIINYDKFRNFLSRPGNNSALLKRALLLPGPDIAVLDEGHLLSSVNSQRSVAARQISTARRIVLTGTPLQNNLEDLFAVFAFVRPHLLPDLGKFRKRFVQPCKEGSYQDSAPAMVSLFLFINSLTLTHILALLFHFHIYFYSLCIYSTCLRVVSAPCNASLRCVE